MKVYARQSKIMWACRAHTANSFSAGLAIICDKRLAIAASTSPELLEIEEVVQIVEADKDASQNSDSDDADDKPPSEPKTSTRKRDVIDFTSLAWECKLTRLASQCIHFIIHNHEKVGLLIKSVITKLQNKLECLYVNVNIVLPVIDEVAELLQSCQRHLQHKSFSIGGLLFWVLGIRLR